MINDPLVQQLVQELSAQARWVIVAVAMATVAILALIAGAYWFQREYHNERGAIQARLDSIDALKRVIEAQTEVVQEIESKFEYSTWHAKERNQLLRQKLEILLTTALEIEAYVEAMRDYSLFMDAEPTMPDPRGKLLALQTLYFPDLQGESSDVWRTSGDYMAACRTGLSHRIEDYQAKLNARVPFNPQWRSFVLARQADVDAVTESYGRLNACLLILRTRCGAKMAELLAALQEQRD